MKILHVFHGSELRNGVDRTSLTLIAALRERGVDCTALVPLSGAVSSALERLQIPWREMPVHCCTGPSQSAELRYLGKSGERAGFLRDLLVSEDFDLVHINTGHLLDAALAAGRAGVPAIWHIHGPFDFDYQRYARLLTLEGYAGILECLGSALIGVSNDVSESLRTHISQTPILTVYNGIDVTDLRNRAAMHAESIRLELDLPPSAKLVLGVGRVSAQKDFASFVQVAELVLARNASVVFLIAGPPENQHLYSELQSRINSQGLRGKVFLLGPRDDVPHLMQQSDIYLSTAIFEGQGLTTLEAMALDCPVVAMACVGLRECVADGHDGLLVPPGDIEGAAVAVTRLLSDATLASTLRQQARATVEQRFSHHAYAEQFLKVAQQAVARGPSTVPPALLELINGLLDQFGRANSWIEQCNRPIGFSERIGRRLDQIGVRYLARG